MNGFSNNHNLQITRGRSNLLWPGEKLGRIKVSAGDVGDGDRDTEAAWGSVLQGHDFATQKVGRASFLPFAGPGTRPALAPPPETRAWASPPRILGNAIQRPST